MNRLLAALLLISGGLFAQSTDHQNNTRTAGDAAEYVLQASTIAAPVSFGLLGSYATDGAVFAQPVYAPAVTVAGATHDVLVVATMHGSIYAFDADVPASAPLWHAGPFGSRTNLAPFSGPSPSGFINGEVGCLATPAIDPVGGFVYALCTNSAPIWTLFQFSLATGAAIQATALSATVAGSGDPAGGDTALGGYLAFYPYYALCRPGLTLANGNIYAACGAWNDTHPWHGWIFAYSQTTLAQVAAFCVTPNGYGGGIWQGSGGLAVDGSGNLYAGTGNGTYDGTTDYGESVIKLSPALVLLDWFTPSNYAALDAVDADVSSGRVILPPGTALAVIGMKDYNVYSIATGCMGHLGGMVSPCTAPQIFATGSGIVGSGTGIYGGAFLNGMGYWPNVAGQIYGFALAGSTWSTTPVMSSATSTGFPFPGAMLSASSNGTAGGLLWGVTFASNAYYATPPGTLRAFNPLTLGEIWNSGTMLGTPTKFAAPTIANGRVYVAMLNAVAMFGLGPAATNGAVFTSTAASGKALGTVYQNTTGRPLIAHVTSCSATNFLESQVDTVTPPTHQQGQQATSATNCGELTVTVPNLYYYRVTMGAGGAVAIWDEAN